MPVKDRAVRAALVAGVLLAATTASPAHAQPQADVVYGQQGSWVAANACVAEHVLNAGTTTMTVALASTSAAPGAIATRVGCGIVQGGRVVALFQSALPGPVAATAGTRSIPIAPYSVCAFVYALFPTGEEIDEDHCP
jgi:hypothetical protein